MGKREQLLEIMEDAAKGETKATLRARIAALEAQLAEAKEALTAIDGLAVMEINPSNYDHDDVCELNRNASHASVIARDALSALEATPTAPKDHLPLRGSITAADALKRWANDPIPISILLAGAEIMELDEYDPERRVHQIVQKCFTLWIEHTLTTSQEGREYD